MQTMAEALEQNENGKSETVRLRTTNDGKTWYLDKNGKAVVLDDAATDEMNRQQMDPASEPSPGYPKFNRMMAFEELPADAVHTPTTPETPAPPTATETIPAPAQTPPEPPQPAPGTEEASQFSTYTGPAGKISQAHRDRISHPDFVRDLHDLAHQHANAAPAPEQQPQSSEQQPQPPAEPLLDPLFFRPSALNRGAFTHRDRPDETFTLEQVAQESLRFQQQGQRQAPTQPQNPEQQRGPEIANAAELEQLLSRLAQRNQTGQETPSQQYTPRAQPRNEPPQEQVPTFGVVPRFVRRTISAITPPQQPIVRFQGPTMDVVLKDNKQREHMYKLLTLRGRTDLIEKFHQSKNNPDAMSDEDWGTLEHNLVELQRRTLLSAEMKSNMTAEDIRYMLDNSLAFAPLRASLKPERAAEVIRNYMDTLFMTASDEDIDRMVFAQRANRDIRVSKQYQGLRERTQERLRIANLSPENVNWSALNLKTAMRVFRAPLFSLKQTTQRSFETMNAVNTNINTITNILGASLRNDRILHNRMINEVETGEAIPETIVTGPKTVKEASTQGEASKQALDLPKLRASVPEFKKHYEQRYGRSWESDSPETRRDNFMESVRTQEEQRSSSLSWFGALIAAVRSALMDRARNDAELNTALAAA